MSKNITESATALTHIKIRGARTHNLKNVSLNLPRNKLIVFTGLSGSGKSSLAFDTIYAEGQRRYVESLSAYARQFLEMMEKPDVDSIEGLSPAISIEQKTTSKNPRSTVATVTEIYDYMRLLWARAGTPYSPTTGLPIQSQTISEMVDRTMALEEGTPLLILAPIMRDRKGDGIKELKELIRKGFTRAKIDGEIYDLDQAPKLARQKRHTIEVVVDRVKLKEGVQGRLADSFESALELSDGLVLIEEYLRDGEKKEPLKLQFSSRYSCPVSGFMIESLEPRLFSFNAPMGACKSCGGLGIETRFDEDLIVPDDKLSLYEGAIMPWRDTTVAQPRTHANYFETMEAIAKALDVDIKTPWNKLPTEARRYFMNGIAPVNEEVQDKLARLPFHFRGLIPQLERRLKYAETNRMRENIAKYQSDHPCPTCHGARLNEEALSVKVAGATINDVAEMSISDALSWFAKAGKELTEQQNSVASPIFREIILRLEFLNHVGLNYLELNRASRTLSGGESQRIRLASQIGAGLTGVLYVLDEPSIGLHQRDNEKLLEMLKRLRDLGNTVIVVEHDEDAIRTADYLVDIGPKAGLLGGNIMATGTPKQVEKDPNSLTGKWLSGKEKIEIPKKRRKPTGWIEVKNATGHNLKNVSVRFPLGVLNIITGVSGSGKSSLVMDTLYKRLARDIMHAGTAPLPCKSIVGQEQIDKIIHIDQTPIGRTPRSNPATYTDLFTPIREWFAQVPEARARGYQPGRFSFNVKGGRCEACQGDGVLKIEMHFLPDVFVTCESCKGKRYNRETLEIKVHGKSIADVLQMTVDEALPFFQAMPRIHDRLSVLQQVGLGYLKLGHYATTLSGGEAQRIKLAKELSRRSTGKTLYILDEPTTGLHMEDIRKLLAVLQALVDQGNTVLIIEHNLDMIKSADWLIDVGPEGGNGGGEILAEGTPEAVAKCKRSHTGRFLGPLLK